MMFLPIRTALSAFKSLLLLLQHQPRQLLLSVLGLCSPSLRVLKLALSLRPLTLTLLLDTRLLRLPRLATNQLTLRHLSLTSNMHFLTTLRSFLVSLNRTTKTKTCLLRCRSPVRPSNFMIRPHIPRSLPLVLRMRCRDPLESTLQSGILTLSEHTYLRQTLH